jgi:hypothetical protein
MKDETDTPRDHRIEEGGWQKSVASPQAKSRPGGLPTASTQPAASTNSGSKKKRDG